MRLHLSLLALASIAVLPCSALAQEERPPRPAPDGAPAEASPRAYPPRPETPHREYGPYPRSGPRPAPGRPYRVPPPAARPRYWWGWGWGWYPIYPVRPVSPPPPGESSTPATERDRLSTRFALYGAGRTDGYMAGLSFAIESRFVGVDADVSALARESVTGPLHRDGSDPATWSTAHLTWSLLNERSIRIRLETGGSILALPDSPAVAGQPWRGKTLLGPDVGVSGQLGLLGPLGVEGWARLTPFPTRVADTYLGLAVHSGPLGLDAGWRWVDIAGNEQDAPRMMFRGPQVGLALAF
jgi:hypothetical protein